MLKTLVDHEVSCIDISFMPEDCLVLAPKTESTNDT